MPYKSLESALLDLEKHGMLLRISEEVSPDLIMPKMAEIATQENLPALLFERVQNSPFRASGGPGEAGEPALAFNKTVNASIFYFAKPSNVQKRLLIFTPIPSKF